MKKTAMEVVTETSMEPKTEKNHAEENNLPKKRKSLSIEQKIRIITEKENGATHTYLARKYHIPSSTLSTIWKERTKIKLFFDSNLSKLKRARTTQYTEIDKALLTWYKSQKANNIPCTARILQEKAEEFGKQLGDLDFVCSLSWIQRFRARHDLSNSKNSDEVAEVVYNGVKQDYSPSDSEILTTISEEQAEQQEVGEEQPEEEFKVPSLSEGLKAISVLRKIVICYERFQASNFEETLVKLEREMQYVKWHNFKCWAREQRFEEHPHPI